MATGALAQEQKPQQPLLAEYHFTFTPQQIGVSQSPNELPMRIAAPMLQVMREQALAQQAKAQKETARVNLPPLLRTRNRACDADYPEIKDCSRKSAAHAVAGAGRNRSKMMNELVGVRSFQKLDAELFPKCGSPAS